MSISTKQSLAFWELCRQGLPLIATAATECWEQGKRFQLGQDIQVARSLQGLIEQCNWEVERPVDTA